MNSRYDYVKKVKNIDGKIVTTSFTMPVIEPKDTDVYIITSSTDRLDALSNKYYGSPKYWWVIAMVNNINTGTMVLPSNMRLFIPSELGDVTTKVKQANM